MQKQVLVLCEDCPDRVACATPQNRCDVVRMVVESRTAQGLPVKVTDPEVLAQIAVLLGMSGRSDGLAAGGQRG